MLRLNSRATGSRDYWVWKNKPEGEAGAAKTVLTTAGHHIVDLRAREPGQDPPDCEAIIDGLRCGIEVSELLDQAALEKSIKGAEQHFAWQRESLCLALQNRIDRKDRPTPLKGGPYEKYFLVIVTDELFLHRECVAQFLKGATFQSRLITDAYLGLSYHPD
jgi:hypothetical protein